MFGGVNFSNYAREEGIEARCTDFLSITSSNKYALTVRQKQEVLSMTTYHSYQNVVPRKISVLQLATSNEGLFVC